VPELGDHVDHRVVQSYRGRVDAGISKVHAEPEQGHLLFFWLLNNVHVRRSVEAWLVVWSAWKRGKGRVVRNPWNYLKKQLPIRNRAASLLLFYF
jgi:hypothetical protein